MCGVCICVCVYVCVCDLWDASFFFSQWNNNARIAEAENTSKENAKRFAALHGGRGKARCFVFCLCKLFWSYVNTRILAGWAVSHPSHDSWGEYKCNLAQEMCNLGQLSAVPHIAGLNSPLPSAGPTDFMQKGWPKPKLTPLQQMLDFNPLWVGGGCSKKCVKLFNRIKRVWLGLSHPLAIWMRTIGVLLRPLIPTIHPTENLQVNKVCWCWGLSCREEHFRRCGCKQSGLCDWATMWRSLSLC